MWPAIGALACDYRQLILDFDPGSIQRCAIGDQCIEKFRLDAVLEHGREGRADGADALPLDYRSFRPQLLDARRVESCRIGTGFRTRLTRLFHDDVSFWGWCPIHIRTSSLCGQELSGKIRRTVIAETSKGSQSVAANTGA